MDNEFPKINRGNGVMNDNLATLGEIMLATKNKTDSIDLAVNATKDQVKNTEATIQRIDKQNAPREISSFRLLVISVVLSGLGIIISLLALIK